MKRTKFFAGAAALVFAMSLSLLSCSNEEKETTNKESAFLSVDDAAFSILRSLTNLSEYDENKVEDESGEMVGVESLPSNWRNIDFTCDQGVVLNDENPGVYSIASNGIDDAKEFFSSMIGETVAGNTYEWSYDGLGSLKFSTVSGNEDLFATVSVNIKVLPEVKELQFVPVDVIEEAKPENASSAVPFFDAGDIIRRTKDNTYWICVRPAGGILKKDKSYWICLNPAQIITSQKKTYTNLTYDSKKYSQTWTYATKLMSLKTAKAAYHTFSLITQTEEGTPIYNCMKSKMANLANLGFSSDGYEKFCFAYDGPKNDSARSGVKLAQPFIVGYTSWTKGSDVAKNWDWAESGNEYIDVHFSTTYATVNDVTKTVAPKFLFSLTDDYDDAHMEKNFNRQTQRENFTDEPYNYEDYIHTYDSESGLLFVKPERTYLEGVFDYNVIISPELMIKDNKGDSQIAKNPLKEKDFEIICALDYAEGAEEPLDWWDSLGVTFRFVDGKYVAWDSENN